MDFSVKVWTGLIWFKICSHGEYIEHVNVPLGSIKRNESLVHLSDYKRLKGGYSAQLIENKADTISLYIGTNHRFQ
jgi:hypothetical protein